MGGNMCWLVVNYLFSWRSWDPNSWLTSYSLFSFLPVCSSESRMAWYTRVSFTALRTHHTYTNTQTRQLSPTLEKQF